jgi:hypothetical protein
MSDTQPRSATSRIVACRDRALALARRTDRPYSLAIALTMAAHGDWLRGAHPAAIECLTELGVFSSSGPEGTRMKWRGIASPCNRILLFLLLQLILASQGPCAHEVRARRDLRARVKPLLTA